MRIGFRERGKKRGVENGVNLPCFRKLKAVVEGRENLFDNKWAFPFRGKLAGAVGEVEIGGF